MGYVLHIELFFKLVMSNLIIMQEGFAPLTVASYFGHKDVVAILLKANATPDIQEKVKHHTHKE